MVSTSVPTGARLFPDLSSRIGGRDHFVYHYNMMVNAVETEYDATVHGILGNLRGGFGDMIAFRHAMRGHTF